MLTYFIGAATPGLGTMAIASASVKYGRGSGFCVMLGVMAAGQIWALCAAIGFSSILLSLPIVMPTVELIGGLYFVYLGVMQLFSERKAADTVLSVNDHLPSAFSSFRLGFFIQLLNPKAIFGWFVIISLGVEQGSPWYIPMVIIAFCLIIGVFVFGSYAVIFAKVSSVGKNRRFERLLFLTASAVFIGSGGWLILRGVDGLL